MYMLACKRVIIYINKSCFGGSVEIMAMVVVYFKASKMLSVLVMVSLSKKR